ncbi:hypothetical protein BGZ70_005270, partial [Mortierella alpina]
MCLMKSTRSAPSTSLCENVTRRENRRNPEAARSLRRQICLSCCLRRRRCPTPRLLHCRAGIPTSMSSRR